MFNFNNLTGLILTWMMMTCVFSMSDSGSDIEETMEMRQTNSTSKSFWAQLQINNKPTVSMPYGSYRINIYAQSSNTQASPTNTVGSNTYYYAPLMLLDNMSANSSFNKVNLKFEMSFRIWFWTQDVQDAVVKYIQTEYDPSAKASFIQVIPFERVILSTTASSITPGYTMPADWIPYQMNQFLKFKLTCFQQTTCDDLASLMKTQPEDFSHFLMLFDMSSSTAQTTKLDINVANLQNGNLASKLIQKLPNVETAYLTADDKKQLLVESATKIIINSFTDRQVVDANSQEQIMNIVQNLLIAGQAAITSKSSTMWNSVFWNQDNYRPDVASSTLNSMYKQLDTTNQREMEKSFSNSKSETNSFGVNLGAGKFSVGISASWEKAVTNSGAMSEKELNNLSQAAASTVAWNGTAFTPKPQSLSMVNMNKLKNTQSFQSQSVQVSYTTAILSLAINSVPSSGLLPTANPAIDFQLKFNALQSQVENMEKPIAALQSQVEKMEKPIAGSTPTSCRDVQSLGWKKSGLYLVKSSSSANSAAKVITVYCDYTKAPGATGYETMIGYNDVKTLPGSVSFYVQRSTSYSSKDTVIPYQEIRLNIGGAMNAVTGIFTAPVNGRYYFSFTGMSNSTLGNTAFLRVNTDRRFGVAWTPSGYGYNLPIVATLQLKKGDTVDTYLDDGSLHDSYNHHTQFSGFLLEEDLV